MPKPGKKMKGPMRGVAAALGIAVMGAGGWLAWSYVHGKMMLPADRRSDAQVVASGGNLTAVDPNVGDPAKLAKGAAVAREIVAKLRKVSDAASTSQRRQILGALPIVYARFGDRSHALAAWEAAESQGLYGPAAPGGAASTQFAQEDADDPAPPYGQRRLDVNPILGWATTDPQDSEARLHRRMAVLAGLARGQRLAGDPGGARQTADELYQAAKTSHTLGQVVYAFNIVMVAQAFATIGDPARGEAVLVELQRANGINVINDGYMRGQMALSCAAGGDVAGAEKYVASISAPVWRGYAWIEIGHFHANRGNTAAAIKAMQTGVALRESAGENAFDSEQFLAALTHPSGVLPGVGLPSWRQPGDVSGIGRMAPNIEHPVTEGDKLGAKALELARAGDVNGSIAMLEMLGNRGPRREAYFSIVHALVEKKDFNGAAQVCERYDPGPYVAPAIGEVIYSAAVAGDDDFVVARITAQNADLLLSMIAAKKEAGNLEGARQLARKGVAALLAIPDGERADQALARLGHLLLDLGAKEDALALSRRLQEGTPTTHPSTGLSTLSSTRPASGYVERTEVNEITYHVPGAALLSVRIEAGDFDGALAWAANCTDKRSRHKALRLVAEAIMAAAP